MCVRGYQHILLVLLPDLLDVLKTVVYLDCQLERTYENSHYWSNIDALACRIAVSEINCATGALKRKKEPSIKLSGFARLPGIVI